MLDLLASTQSVNASHSTLRVERFREAASMTPLSCFIRAAAGVGWSGRSGWREGREVQMTQISATWTGGMFKPDEAVPLPDQTRVRLTVEPIDEWSPERAKAALEALKRLVQKEPIASGGVRFTRDQLHEGTVSLSKEQVTHIFEVLDHPPAKNVALVRKLLAERSILDG
jgi:hypothetical protein